ETDGTREELLGLTRSDHPAISARALAGLATLARREADLSVAREHLEDALARLTGDHAAMAADLLLPSLLAQRAVVMAAEGATEEAENEVRALAERFPSY